MLKHFLHLSIIWQVALAPALLLAMTSGVFWWFDSNTEQSLTASEDASQQSLQSVSAIYTAAAIRSQHINDIAATISKVDSEVTRHISLVGSGASDAELARIRTAIAAGLAHAKLLIEDDAAGGGSDPTSANTVLLAGYAQAVTQIGDIAERDRLRAIILLAPMEAKRQELDRNFRALQEAGQATAQNQAEQVRRRSADAIIRVRAAAAAARINRWGVAACVFAIGLVLSLLIGRGIARPLAAITRTTTRLAGGDLGVEVPAADRNDEIGRMARALGIVKGRMIEEKRLAAGQDQAPAQEKPTGMIHTANLKPLDIAPITEPMRRRATPTTATAEPMASSPGRPGDAAKTAAPATNSAQPTVGADGELTAAVHEIGNPGARPVTAGTDHPTTIGALNQEREQAGSVAGIAAPTNPPAPNAITKAVRAEAAAKGLKVSTTAVGRAAAPRIPASLPCQLTIADDLHTCQVSELSSGGASVTGVSPYPPGTQGKLSIEGVGTPLPVKVRAIENNTLKLTFVLDVATKFKVSEKLDQLVKELAA